MKISCFLRCLSISLLVSCTTSHQRHSTASSQEASSSSAEMEYVDICDRQRICKKFSRLVLGTDHLVQANWTGEGQPELTEEQSFEVLDEAVRLGINFFDTSPIYVGGVENKLGKWLRSRQSSGRELHVLSKGGFPFDLFWAKQLEAGTHSEEFKQTLRKNGVLTATSPQSNGTVPLNNVPPGTYASRLFGSQEQIKQRVAEELGHTTTNIGGGVSIYLMHRDDNDYFKFDEIKRPQTSVKTIMSALAEPELATKYWQIGWSNWQTDRVNESTNLAKKYPKLHKPVINSPYFSLFEMSQRSIHAGGIQVTHEEMSDPNFQKDIQIMPYSPLGGFSILDKPEPRWENGKKAAKIAYDKGDAYWQNVFPAVFTMANEQRYKRVERFTRDFNQQHGTSYAIDQMINAYALAHKRTSFLAVGPITIEQLRRTVGSLRLARMLTEKDLDYLHSGK